MATAGGDVAGLVHQVVAAFDKAVELVRRIESRKDDENDAEAIQDLSRSLSLGPVIVLGYFDADSKRFGPMYLYGDYQAQFELRDVLLGLKSLVADLQDVLLDDNQIDFRQFQEASDACRSNVGVCLGQLSQRLAQARSDPMTIQLQTPPPMYKSGVPSMGSTHLQDSSSHSTHSSSGGKMPETPDSSTQQSALTHLWQSKQSGSIEHTSTHHRRQGTNSSLQGNCQDWSQMSRLFAERDADQLSVRRPSSHALSPEDGALLSPIRSHQGARAVQELYDPHVEDRAGDVKGWMISQKKVRSLAEQPNISSGGARERYEPDDCLAVHPEQHDPFLTDRSTTRAVGSCTSRASSDQHSTVKHISPDYRHPVAPQPLRLPKPHAQQHYRLTSGPPSSPPRKPVPPVPYGPFNGHATTTQTTPRLQPHGPAFQTPPQVQRAMQSDRFRRQYTVDGSPGSTLEPSSRSHPATQSPTRSNLSSHTGPTVLSQPLYPHTPQHIVNPPQRLQQLAPKPSCSPLIAQPEAQPTPEVVNVPSSTPNAIRIPLNQPLTLPRDNSPHPFCKGAFRLFLGLTKKSFATANRPVGMSSFMPYWRCDKCHFEGPMREAPGPVDKKGRPGKPEKIFDPTIRECGPISTAINGPDGRGEGSGGVRYKWIFLAKCHVPLNNTPDKSDGSGGGYACMFCCAEASSRGWTTSAGSSLSPGINAVGLNDAASTSSGKSRHGSSAATGSSPVFSNLTSFMDHLQIHRRQENWPCPEMLGRMKCIVGRIASQNEEWEINFLPL